MSASARGAPLGNAQEHQDPPPPAGASHMPPPPEIPRPPPESLLPRGPALGTHYLLCDRHEAGFEDRHDVNLTLGDRVPVQAQGRDIGVRHTQRPRMGFHVPATY